jgi:hypothetical protein
MKENNFCMSYSTKTGDFVRLKAVLAMILKTCLQGCDAVSTGE